MLLVQLLPAVAFATALSVIGAKSARATKALELTLIVFIVVSLVRVVQTQISALPPWIPTPAKALGAALFFGVVAILVGWKSQWFLAMVVRTAPVVALASAALLAPIAVTELQPRSQSVAQGDNAAFVIVFDELGADVLGVPEIDESRFPNLAALSKKGLWLTDAVTNYHESCRAIPSLLSGNFVPLEACRQFNLLGAGSPSVLARIATHVPVMTYGEYLRDCPRPEPYCLGLPDLIAADPLPIIVKHLVPRSLRFGPTAELLGATQQPYTLALWRRFLADIGPASLGQVTFLHLLLPHQPFVFNPDGTLHRSTYESFSGAESDGLVYENYAKQVGFVDTLVGQFMARLRDEGLSDRTNVAIVGDHGPRVLSVRPEVPELKGVEEQAPRPAVLFAGPFVRGRSLPQDAQYQHLDFAPTLLDLLDLPAMPDTAGRSMFTPLRDERRATFEWDEYTYTRIAGRWTVERK